MCICNLNYGSYYVVLEPLICAFWQQISNLRVNSRRLTRDFSNLHCFLFIAPLTKGLFTYTYIISTLSLLAAQEVINITAFGEAGADGIAATNTLLSGCNNMILGHISSGYKPLWQVMTWNDSRKHLSYLSVDVMLHLCCILSHARCWLSLLIGEQPWSVYTYLTFDAISVRYKETGASLMTIKTVIHFSFHCDAPKCFYNDWGQIKCIGGNINLGEI